MTHDSRTLPNPGGQITIPLTQGHTAVVSEQDADLAQHSWYTRANGSRTTMYACRGAPGAKDGRRLYLHREVLSRTLGVPIPSELMVDHINGDWRDNRRENLRLSTNATNQRNRGAKRASTSTYCGVAWYSRHKKWKAAISAGGGRRNKVEVFLGYFADEEAAARAYDEAALVLHGDYARYNLGKPQTISENIRQRIARRLARKRNP